MTKEEIKALIEAEVERRVATLTAQFGRDLSELYPTKSEVDATIKAMLKKESDEVAKSMNEFAEKVKTTDWDDPDHPLSFLVDIITGIASLQLRVMQIGMYILAKETKVARGPDALEKTMKLSKIEQVTIDQERECFLHNIERSKASTKDPVVLSIINELEGLLGRPPDPKPDKKHQPN